MKRSVLQPWVDDLTFMQQSVLITAVRGPDTLSKEHVAKSLLRWYRRCILYCAFGHKVITDPYEKGGGSFTGPCKNNINDIMIEYLKSVDEIPHHFHLHLIHASEIIGYKHPDLVIRKWWNDFYIKAVNDMHMNIETEEEMDYRLGDKENQWKEKEEFPANR